MIKKETYVPFRERTYDLMKRMILKGRFKPDERLTENLCEGRKSP
jgi:DNA-binding GntR family transcriptional regulator